MNWTTLLTHGGKFHADDVFAAAALRVLAPGAAIVRTRDEALLDDARVRDDVVVFDVGGVDDPARDLFDHHQRGFARGRPNGVRFASLGLVWERYGTDVCAAIVPGVDATRCAAVVDKLLAQPIDAVDNGLASWRGTIAGTQATLEPHCVSRIIDEWNPIPPAEADAYDRAFDEATAWAGGVLRRSVSHAAELVRAEQIVNAADDGGPILRLETGTNWLPFVRPHHLLSVYPAGEHDWRVQCVPPPGEPMAQKVPLPASWAGRRDAELAAETGVADAVFCHPARFTAGARSREGALALAQAALEAGGP